MIGTLSLEFEGNGSLADLTLKTGPSEGLALLSYLFLHFALNPMA